MSNQRCTNTNCHVDKRWPGNTQRGKVQSSEWWFIGDQCSWWKWQWAIHVHCRQCCWDGQCVEHGAGQRFVLFDYIYWWTDLFTLSHWKEVLIGTPRMLKKDCWERQQTRPKFCTSELYRVMKREQEIVWTLSGVDWNIPRAKYPWELLLNHRSSSWLGP